MGRNNILDAYPLPFLGDPQLRLVASGSWSTGGILEIILDDFRLDTLNLSASEWSILALLMDAAKQSASLHWGKAFRTTTKLSRDMHTIANRGVSSDSEIHNGVHKLRKSLDASNTARMQAAGKDGGVIRWSKRIVELHRQLGYRISLPPSQLDLEVLDI